MRSVHTSNNTAVKCSQNPYQIPNQSCNIDDNIQVISNGYFNYAGKKDPLDIVIAHYRVHFDSLVKWVMRNSEYANSTSNFDLFTPEQWKESILEETISDKDKSDTANASRDVPMENDEINSTGDTCENDPTFEDISNSDSDSPVG